MDIFTFSTVISIVCPVSLAAISVIVSALSVLFLHEPLPIQLFVMRVTPLAASEWHAGVISFKWASSPTLAACTAAECGISRHVHSVGWNACLALRVRESHSRYQ